MNFFMFWILCCEFLIGIILNSMLLINTLEKCLENSILWCEYSFWFHHIHFIILNAVIECSYVMRIQFLILSVHFWHSPIELKSVHHFGLSSRIPVCPRSNSHKFTSSIYLFISLYVSLSLVYLFCLTPTRLNFKRINS